MITNYTPKELIEFEEDIADCFNRSLIKAPVHLYNGNEKQMIEVFKKQNIGHDDWVLCSWRSHYQCLLKGVPQDELKAAILQGRSISLCFAKLAKTCSATRSAASRRLSAKLWRTHYGCGWRSAY